MSEARMDAIQDMPERDMERAVIGAILFDPESVVEAMESLEQKHFADPLLGAAYQAAVDAFQLGEPPEMMTIADALGADYPNAFEVILEISTWANNANVLPVYMTTYARGVRRWARTREFQNDIPKMLHRLMSDRSADPVEVLAEWLGKFEVEYRSDDPGPRPLSEMMDEVARLIDGKREGTVVDEQTVTPWPSLTNMLGGGVKPGEVCVVAGRPGSGKTVCAAQMLFEASLTGQAIMFSSEMSYDTVIQRMIACETGIPFAKIADPQRLNADEYDLMRSYMDSLSVLPVFVDDLIGVSTSQMMSRTQMLQRNGKVSMMIFDYLELAGDTAVDRKNQEAWISDVIRSLKIIARRLNIPVVVLAQLSREVERRNPPIPKLSDLRMSGMIEQVADKVLMLYRPQYYVQQGMLEPDPEVEHLMEFYIHKNRNGQSGKVPLRYDGPVFRISEFEVQPTYEQGGIL